MPSEILVKRLYIPDCKISLALLLIRSFIRIRSFFFVRGSFLTVTQSQSRFSTHPQGGAQAKLGTFETKMAAR